MLTLLLKNIVANKNIFKCIFLSSTNCFLMLQMKRKFIDSEYKDLEYLTIITLVLNIFVIIF